MSDKDMNMINGENGFIDIAVHFQKLMMFYESAAKVIVTRLEILRQEFRVKGVHCPIESVKSRVKKPQSIARKLMKAGLDVSFESIEKNLNDVAGVRIICPYVSDIYTVRKILYSSKNMKIVEEKDYVKKPKESGYRSLHLLALVPVQLSDGEKPVRVEIQIRTISMDSWATVEHNLRYKAESENVTEDAIKKLQECSVKLAEVDDILESVAKQILPDYYSYDWDDIAGD